MNNYFGQYQSEDEKKQARSIPAWVWIISVIGLILSIIWGYSFGSYAAYIAELGIIEDVTEDSSKLGVLDFSECLLIFSGGLSAAYNLIDYPVVCTSYTSSRKANSFGTPINTFTRSAEFDSSFVNMNGYDVSCVLDPDIYDSCNMHFSFIPQLSSGNLEARLFEVSKDYKIDSTSDGANRKINESYINLIDSFDGDEPTVTSFTAKVGYYYIFVVGAESAVGSYELDIHIP